MKQARIALAAALTVAVAACGAQTGTGETGEATPAAEMTSPAADMAAPTMPAAAPANLPAAADLTVDQLPGVAATGEIQTTPSGLRYVMVKEGTGDKPTADSTVKVHYSGYLTDGTPFDSSVDRGEPATFPLNGVIPGWTEGLQLMAPGAQYKLIVPPELGYGASGFPPVIPPNAALVFDVELIEVLAQ